LSRNRQVSARSGLAQGVALQTYSQYVEAQGASTAWDGGQLAVAAEVFMNNPG
jgi:hypothetical protein